MGFLGDLFSGAPAPSANKQEVQRLIDELVQIGKRDDFLSERPGGQFNAQCRNTRGRAIGKRLYEIGGMDLMEYAQKKVARKASKALAAHLEYCWAEIGNWMKSIS